ncbi:MAG: class B sortase [Lachnospiraceae bacterium]|nr:class B sortase [Lachnospiraceae bacterium]MDY5742334.1 class B sortase [Lachnospiraceae bacterium]
MAKKKTEHSLDVQYIDVEQGQVTGAGKKKKKKKGFGYWLSTVVLIAAIGGFVYSGANLALIYLRYQASQKEYKSLEKYVSGENTENKTINSTNRAQVQAERDEESKKTVVNYDSLKEINGDYQFWLKYPGLDLSYPVVHTADNEYYLNYTFEKQSNVAGAVFLEAANKPDLSDLHSIIYGHKMNIRYMFTALLDLRKPETALNNPFFYIYTKDKVKKYHVFSSFVADAAVGVGTDYDISMNAEQDTAALQAYAARCAAKSEVDYGTDLSDLKQMVSLSTCIEYGDWDHRFIVMAKLVEETPLSGKETQ